MLEYLGENCQVGATYSRAFLAFMIKMLMVKPGERYPRVHSTILLTLLRI